MVKTIEFHRHVKTFSRNNLMDTTYKNDYLSILPSGEAIN